MSSVTRRWWIVGFGVVALAVAAFVLLRVLAGAPAATTPEGAYVRVAEKISSGDVEGVFGLLDDASRDACARLSRARKDARALVDGTFPEPDRTRLLAEYAPVADAADAAGVWRVLSASRGWVTLLRRDLSGVDVVEAQGDAATIRTARGARYPFARRSDGTWGIALFTDDLLEDAWRAERDLETIESASADYARVH